MRNPFRIGLLVAARMISIAPAAVAVPVQIVCPTEIPAPSIQVVNTPGWKPYVLFPLFLASAGMSAGPPETLAVLRGEPLNKKGQRQSTRYEFGEMGVDQGKWLNCGYGENSAVTLSKRLDDSFKECTVTHLSPERSDKQNIRIACK